MDDPFLVRYGRFVWNAFHGDFGRSIRGQTPVINEIMERLPKTGELTLAAMLFSCLVGIPAGAIAARNQGKFTDGAIMVTALVGTSLPSFWLAIMLITIFGVKLGWISVVGGEGLKELILPAIVLGLGPAAVLARLTRSSMIEVMEEDYVRTARGKGLSERLVIVRHIMRNSFIPVLTYLGLLLADLLGGAVFTESVFGRPGLGRFAVNAISARDFPQIQGMVLFTASIYVVFNLLVDILYSVVDPRIRLS